VISKLFATFAAKVAIVALAGGFATGGLAAAGAFSSPGHALAHVTSATTVGLQTSSDGGASQATTTATVADPDDHRPTSAAESSEPAETDRPTGTVTPKPEHPTSTVAEDNDGDEGVTGTVESDDADDTAAVNHGHCVSFAASIVHSLGLTGEQNGAFLSLVAKDKTAVSAKVATGGTPDAACAVAIAKAKIAAAATAVTATVDDHGGESGDHEGNHDHHDGNGGDKTSATTTSATTSTKDDRGGDHH